MVAAAETVPCPPVRRRVLSFTMLDNAAVRTLPLCLPAQSAAMFPVRQLYDLQQLDIEAASTEESLADVRARLADESALAATRHRISEFDGQLAELEPTRRQSERLIEETRERLESIESRLYGGVITNPRELAAAEEQRSFLHTQQTDQEDKLLELMMGIEETQTAREATTEELARAEAAREDERPGLKAKESRFELRLEELRHDWDEAVPQFAANTLAIYERLRNDRNGYAVAKVERGMCQGCRITLPSGELQRVRNAQDLVQCSSCQRILFVA